MIRRIGNRRDAEPMLRKLPVGWKLKMKKINKNGEKAFNGGGEHVPVPIFLYHISQVNFIVADFYFYCYASFHNNSHRSFAQTN